MGPDEISEVCLIDDAGRSLLRGAMQQMQMSARAYHRILKLARTISDLEGNDKIETGHIAEEMQLPSPFIPLFYLIQPLPGFFVRSPGVIGPC
jgi:predicted ATPase with chaperone activity